MKNQILKLLSEHKQLSGPEIGMVVDPVDWANHIHRDLEELVKEGKILQIPPPANTWEVYRWSLK